MRFLLIFLAALMLTGCAAPAPAETTVPETVAVFVPATETVPETTVPPTPEDLLLEAMTLEQKVGQLFIVAPEQLLPGSGAITSMSEALEVALERYPVGGVILFANNIQSPRQLSAFTKALSEASATGRYAQSVCAAYLMRAVYQRKLRSGCTYRHGSYPESYGEGKGTIL